MITITSRAKSSVLAWLFSIQFKVYWQNIGEYYYKHIHVHMSKAIFCKLTKRNCEKKKRNTQTRGLLNGNRY